MSITVKLSRVERILNAALRVAGVPKADDPYLAKVRAILAEERAEGFAEGRAALEPAPPREPRPVCRTCRHPDTVHNVMRDTFGDGYAHACASPGCGCVSLVVPALPPAPLPTHGRCRCPDEVVIPFGADHVWTGNLRHSRVQGCYSMPGGAPPPAPSEECPVCEGTGKCQCLACQGAKLDCESCNGTGRATKGAT